MKKLIFLLFAVFFSLSLFGQSKTSRDIIEAKQELKLNGTTVNEIVTTSTGQSDLKLLTESAIFDLVDANAPYKLVNGTPVGSPVVGVYQYIDTSSTPYVFYKWNDVGFVKEGIEFFHTGTGIDVNEAGGLTQLKLNIGELPLEPNPQIAPNIDYILYWNSVTGEAKKIFASEFKNSFNQSNSFYETDGSFSGNRLVDITDGGLLIESNSKVANGVYERVALNLSGSLIELQTGGNGFYKDKPNLFLSSSQGKAGMYLDSLRTTGIEVDGDSILQITTQGINISNLDTGTVSQNIAIDEGGNLIKTPVQVIDNIYTADGVLTGDRTVNMNGNNLTFDGTSDVTIKSDGKIGLGILNPLYALDIQTLLTNASPAIRVNSKIYLNHNGSIFWGTNALNGHLSYSTGTVVIGARANNYLRITSNNVEAIRVDLAGNVKIGPASNPSEKLDVNGNIKLSGVLKLAPQTAFPTTAAKGDIIYQDFNGINKPQFYNGTAWGNF